MKYLICVLFSHNFQMAAGGDQKWSKDAADQNFDYMFKLLIIGNSSVGKTSFLFRYADDSFTSAFVSTVGIDFKVKTVFRHDKRVKLQIWVSIAPIRFGCNKNNSRKPKICWINFVCLLVIHQTGYSWTREIPNHNNGILQRSYGLHFDVWYHKWREFQFGTRLVRWRCEDNTILMDHLMNVFKSEIPGWHK